MKLQLSMADCFNLTVEEIQTEFQIKRIGI